MSEPPREPDATQRIARSEAEASAEPEAESLDRTIRVPLDPTAPPKIAPETTVPVPRPEGVAPTPAGERTAPVPAVDATAPMPVPGATVVLPAGDAGFTPPPELPEPVLELPAPLPPALPDLPAAAPSKALPEAPAAPRPRALPEPPAAAPARVLPETPAAAPSARSAAPPHGNVAVGESRAQVAPRSALPFLSVLALAVVAVLALFALLGRGGGPGPEPPAVGTAEAANAAGSATATAPVEERVLLSFRDRGGELAVTTRERVHGLEGVDPAVQRRLARALTAGDLVLPGDLAALAGGRAGAEGLAPLSPVGTRVPDERPTLRWRPAAESAAYVVTVADASGQSLAVSPALRGSEWQPPRALPRRRTLAWWIETRPRGRGAEPERTPPARFSVLAPEDAAFVERELAAGHGSRLVAAVLWAEVGALEEARAAAAELAAANPASPEIRRLRERLAGAGGS